MASELKVDKISGVASAGAVLVTAEGGTTTTSLTQGLVKGWANFSMSGTPAFRDSINMASITDNGTGDYTYAITNDMASVNYCVPTGALYAALQGTFAQATDSYRIKCFGRADSLTAENTTHFVTIFGDLA